MTAFYITSTTGGAGKTALCAALGKRLADRGKRVGFLKPVLVASEEPGAGVVDKDTEFIKQVLGLEEPVDSLCPIALTLQALDAIVSAKDESFFEKVQAAYGKVCQGRDVVVLEGLSGLELASSQIVASLDAKAVLVARYAPNLVPDEIAAAGKPLGERLIGVVINAVPQQRVDSLKASMLPSLEGSGMRVLGVLPEDRLLFTVTVGELADWLGGEMLNCPERSNELVENLMVGVMSVDCGLEYFNLKPNKAVITRGDRPDIQLAALETSTRCLILTSNLRPTPSILYRAGEKGVPIVVVEQDTLATVAAIEGVFGKARFHSEQKLERLEEILDQHLDFSALYSALG